MKAEAKERQRQHGGTAPGRKNTGDFSAQVSKGKSREQLLRSWADPSAPGLPAAVRPCVPVQPKIIVQQDLAGLIFPTLPGYPIAMTDDQSALIKGERNGLSAMLLLFAISRDLEARATGDRRFSAAADAIKQIETTLHMIDDATLLKLVTVNETSEGALLQLIAARPARHRVRVAAVWQCGGVLRAVR
jgi:hypothetical protein